MRLKAISNVYGRIEELLIAIDGEQTSLDSSSVKSNFGLLIDAFQDRQTIVCLGNFKDAKGGTESAVAGKLGAQRLRLIHTEDGAGHDHWIQDPFCVLNSPEGQVALLEPFYFDKEENRFLAEQLSHGYGSLIRSTRYHLEGGNVLIGDDYMLVGCNTLAENKAKLFPKLTWEVAKEKLTTEFKALFGVNYVIWVGEETPFENPLNLPMGKDYQHQLLFHLDLFLTLGGKSKDEKHQGDELIFVADIFFNHDKASKTDDVKGLGVGDDRWKELEQLRVQLDKVAKFFAEFAAPGPRFHVVRLPMQISFSEKSDPVIYSYNNCLAEYYHGIRRAYLPNFRLAEHEKENHNCECSECRACKKLTGLGFRVVIVNDSFDQYARNRGGLHCLTKVLKRSAY